MFLYGLMKHVTSQQMVLYPTIQIDRNFVNYNLVNKMRYQIKLTFVLHEPVVFACLDFFLNYSCITFQLQCLKFNICSIFNFGFQPKFLYFSQITYLFFFFFHKKRLFPALTFIYLLYKFSANTWSCKWKALMWLKLKILLSWHNKMCGFLITLSAYHCSLVLLPLPENVDGGTMILYLRAKIHVLSVWNNSAQWPQKVHFS